MLRRFKKTLPLIAVMVFIVAAYLYYKEQIRIRQFLVEINPDIHLLNYSLQLSPSRACPEGTQVVIIVVSSLQKFKVREDIRRTWGMDTYNGHVHRYFIVGTDSDDIDKKITLESNSHDDIIRYDFVDSYLNLTLKSVCLLRWVKEKCTNARYVVKIDDDVFLNVTLLLKLIRDRGNELLLIGNGLTGNKRHRKDIDRFYVPTSEYTEEIFPGYLSGGCYVMSRNVAMKLLSASLSARFLRLEDVFITGVCRKISDLVLSHSDDFLIAYPSSLPCFRWDVIAMVITGDFKNDIYDLYKKRKHCSYNYAVP